MLPMANESRYPQASAVSSFILPLILGEAAINADVRVMREAKSLAYVGRYLGVEVHFTFLLISRP